MNRRVATLLALACTMLLSACHLDVHVDVNMANDGSGVVTVTAVADKELVAAVPDLENDLNFEDAVKNGWTVEDPVVAADGTMTLVLTHPFTSNTELANVLNSIGPPLQNVGIARTSDGKQVTNAIDATLVLSNGYGSFADSDLVAAAGGVPFAAKLEASGVPPADGYSFTLDVGMPGKLVTAATGTDIGNGVIRWEAPTDGTSVSVRAETVQQIGGANNWWARPVSLISLGLLIAWVVFAVGFIIFVAYARRQRSRNRSHALRQLPGTRDRPRR